MNRKQNVQMIFFFLIVNEREKRNENVKMVQEKLIRTLINHHIDMKQMTSSMEQ